MFLSDGMANFFTYFGSVFSAMPAPWLRLFLFGFAMFILYGVLNKFTH